MHYLFYNVVFFHKIVADLGFFILSIISLTDRDHENHIIKMVPVLCLTCGVKGSQVNHL